MTQSISESIPTWKWLRSLCFLFHGNFKLYITLIHLCWLIWRWPRETMQLKVSGAAGNGGPREIWWWMVRSSFNQGLNSTKAHTQGLMWSKQDLEPMWKDSHASPARLTASQANPVSLVRPLPNCFHWYVEVSNVLIVSGEVYIKDDEGNIKRLIKGKCRQLLYVAVKKSKI